LISPSEWVEVGGLNLVSKTDVNTPTPIVDTRAITINFLGRKKIVSKISDINIVGIPLYRKLENISPKVSNVTAWGSFLTYLR
jgi:hypothetical protein